MRIYLKEKIKPVMPSVVRNRMVEVIKNQNSWSAADAQISSQTTYDDIWIPSSLEIYDGNKFYSELFSCSASRIKQLGTKVEMWYLRNAQYNNMERFMMVTETGSTNNYISVYPLGVVLCFCT